MPEIFIKNKIPDKNKLAAFGFCKTEAGFLYTQNIADGEMRANVTVSAEGRVFLDVFDTAGEEYTLFNVPSAAGVFVGKVRSDCEELIDNISAKCFTEQIYQYEQTKAVLEYINRKYHNAPEFLWPKFPDCSAIRRSDSKKWYAALLKVSRTKLGQDSEEKVEIIDLRISPHEVQKTVDNINCFPGYHMNKKHWITFILDGSVETEIIFSKIDTSYLLAKK